MVTFTHHFQGRVFYLPVLGEAFTPACCSSTYSILVNNPSSLLKSRNTKKKLYKNQKTSSIFPLNQSAVHIRNVKRFLDQAAGTDILAQIAEPSMMTTTCAAT